MAEWYASQYGDHATSALAVAAARLAGTETVLDIGCGTGSAVRWAASALSEGGVTGIDPSPAMIRIAKRQSSGHPVKAKMTFVEGAAEALPVDDAGIDVAMAVCSLHHWHDIPKGLSEVARVLRPGGRFIAVEEIFDDPEMGMERHAIQAALEEAGFLIADIAERDDTDWRALVFIAHPGAGQ